MNLLTKFDLRGYRKVLVAVLTFLGAAALLVFGYDVSKLQWLGTPLAAFFAANLVEHIPAVLEKMKGKE